MGWVRRIVVLLALVVLFLARPVYVHARAAALLLRFSGGDSAPRGFARFGMHDVTEESANVDTPLGARKARFYIPTGVSDPPGIVVCHGVHHLGIEEPRMKKFARAIASAGVVVLTPELSELADYHIDPHTIGTIGHAAMTLKTRVKRTGVGVLGLSFAGGLSMLAATEPEYAPSIDFVISVGGHDDLDRVARFFVTDEIDGPAGEKIHLHAHDYGAVVLVYMYVDSFFSPRDAPHAREAIRLWLWEQFDDARNAAARMSPEGQDKVALVFAHREDVLRPEIERVIAAHQVDIRRVSPHGALDGFRARAFLLHGEGDTVIPASETRWLAHDVPDGALASAVVSRAIVHVDMEGTPSVSDRYDLVHLMAGVIEAADHEAPTGQD
jgi:hypothetical protein